MHMKTDLSAEEIVRIGSKLLDEGIRSQVEPGNEGRFLVIDVLSGNYEIADDAVIASNEALRKNPDAVLYYSRIGYPAAFRISGSSLTERK